MENETKKMLVCSVINELNKLTPQFITTNESILDVYKEFIDEGSMSIVELPIVDDEFKKGYVIKLELMSCFDSNASNDECVDVTICPSIITKNTLPEDTIKYCSKSGFIIIEFVWVVGDDISFKGLTGDVVIGMMTQVGTYLRSVIFDYTRNLASEDRDMFVANLLHEIRDVDTIRKILAELTENYLKGGEWVKHIISNVCYGLVKVD